MLKKMLYRKIMVASSLLVIIFLLYLIPSNNNMVELVEEVEYVYPNNEAVIYLLDDEEYVSRTKMSVNKDNDIEEAKDLIKGLTEQSEKKDIIPKGFKQIIPKDTSILDVKLNNKILK